MCTTEKNTHKGLYLRPDNNIMIVYFVAVMDTSNHKYLCYRIYGNPTFRIGPMDLLKGCRKITPDEVRALVKSFIKERIEQGNGTTFVTPPTFE